MATESIAVGTNPAPVAQPKQTETKPKSLSVIRPQTEVKPKFEVKPQTEVKPKSEVKPKTEAKPKSEVKPKTEVKPKSEVKPKTEVKPKPKAKPKSEVKPKAKPTAKPKSEAKPKAKAAAASKIKMTVAASSPKFKRFLKEAKKLDLEFDEEIVTSLFQAMTTAGLLGKGKTGAKRKATASNIYFGERQKELAASEADLEKGEKTGSQDRALLIQAEWKEIKEDPEQLKIWQDKADARAAKASSGDEAPTKTKPKPKKEEEEEEEVEEEVEEEEAEEAETEEAEAEEEEEAEAEKTEEGVDDS